MRRLMLCLGLLIVLSIRAWNESPTQPSSEASTLDWIVSTIDSASTWSGKDVQGLLRAVVDIATDELKRTAKESAAAAVVPYQEALAKAQSDASFWRGMTVTTAILAVATAVTIFLIKK